MFARILFSVLFFILLSFYSLLLADGNVCVYYRDSEFTKNVCRVVESIIDCQSIPIDRFNWEGSYTLVYFVGFGSSRGFFSDKSAMSVIEWQKIAKMNAKILVIDACYSGAIFGFVKSDKIVVTSAPANCVSVNVYIDELRGYVSSFVAMLNCLFGTKNKTYCPAFCDYGDPQLCQLAIVNAYGGFSDRTLKFLAERKDLHPELNIGFTYINGTPWRK